MAESTPGTARTAISAALRTGSQAGTSAASTVIEKNTLPSLTITSESLPVAGNATPSGLFTAARAVRIVFLSTAIRTLRLDSNDLIRVQWVDETPAGMNLTPRARRRRWPK